MRSNKRTILGDELENRSLLSGPGLANLWSNPTIQADLQKIQADQKAFQAEIQTLAPTIQKDQQAIQTAIQNATANNPNVKSAQATLTTAESTAQTTLKNDLKAITSAPNFSARLAALKVYIADAASAAKTIAADLKAVKAAIDADPGVMSARAQLQADEAPIDQDQATLQADYVQLAKDIRAALNPPSSSSTAAGLRHA